MAALWIPLNCAATDVPPSPENPLIPVPARSVSLPVLSTDRTRFPEIISAMIIRPSGVNSTAKGSRSLHWVAGASAAKVPPPAMISSFAAKAHATKARNMRMMRIAPRTGTTQRANVEPTVLLTLANNPEAHVVALVARHVRVPGAATQAGNSRFPRAAAVNAIRRKFLHLGVCALLALVGLE